MEMSPIFSVAFQVPSVPLCHSCRASLCTPAASVTQEPRNASTPQRSQKPASWSHPRDPLPTSTSARGLRLVKASLHNPWCLVAPRSTQWDSPVAPNQFTPAPCSILLTIPTAHHLSSPCCLSMVGAKFLSAQWTTVTVPPYLITVGISPIHDPATFHGQCHHRNIPTHSHLLHLYLSRFQDWQ